ncbi:MAG: DUF2807 domain-containing protein [Bacteroidales bacterium]|nr:DUF2807 domain-containing protein [Bacteroidales bacterium]
MKKLKFYLVVALTTLLFSSCQQDNSLVVTQTFDLDEFKSVDLSIAANVIIEKGETQKVEITGPELTVNEIEKIVNSGIWDINLPENYNKRYLDLEIVITSNGIEEIAISGSGDIIVKDSMPLSSVIITGSGNIIAEDTMPLSSIIITGSGDVDTKIETPTLNSEISGSGNIMISGQTDILKHVLSGSGNFKGFDLQTNDAEITITGSGNIEVFATKNLIVNISGSGNVLYKGNPAITSNISGSGNIINSN